MNFSIPGLDGYFGGKGSSGVPQQIINIIPPHETLIIPFLGHCAITRSIKPAKYFLAFEKDSEVFLKWKSFYNGCDPTSKKIRAIKINREGFNTDIEIINDCGISYLESLSGPFSILDLLFEKPVIYCDPPYLLETRTGGTRYKHEMTKEGHERFLNTVTKIDAPVLVSHYKNDMYDSHLKGWNTISFMSQTRSGKPRRETVYFNYEKPTELHDYSYFGNCYRERENNKKRAANIVAKFERMKPLEKNYYLNALQQSGVISHQQKSRYIPESTA
tara:strand:+ start:70777 stop:71598 length:822 start_codon:yes stop_codon:yes gene_type:complete